MKLFTPAINAAAWVQASERRTQGAAARKFGVSSAAVGKAQSLMHFERDYAFTVWEELALSRRILREYQTISTVDLGRRINLSPELARRIMRTIRFEELCLTYIEAAETGVCA